jgi:small-conductance mechanosensitive channel
VRPLRSARHAVVAALLTLAGLGIRPLLAQTAPSSVTPGDAGAVAPAPVLPKPKRPAPPPSSPAPSDAALPAASAPPDAGVPADAGQASDSGVPVDGGTEPVPSAEPPASAELAPSNAPPPVASVAPVLAPAPVASALPPPIAGSPVQLGDDVLFAIRVPRGGKTAAQRAGEATRALAAAAHEAKADVRFQRKDDVAIVMVGQAPIVQLSADDAKAAGDSSLDVHVASVTAALREGLANERRREARSKAVFSISLLVFFGLIVFYLVRKIGEFAERARLWVDENGERVLAVRVQKIEVVSPATVKSTAVVGLSVAKWFAQFGIIYAWLLVVLSRFEATREYTERLTGFVLTPLSQLMTRIATGLPVLVVLTVAGFAVFVLVRFIGLFLRSVERRETSVAWLSADLAAPASALLRAAVVLAALVFLAPLVTGNPEGALARSGSIVILALGLAATPTFATAVLGAILLFGRRLRPGQRVRIGNYSGRIASIGLLDVRLEDAAGAELRVPHLYSLYQPTQVLGLTETTTLDISVSPIAALSEVRDRLLDVARIHGDGARVELVRVDSEGALFRIHVRADGQDARSTLQLAVATALRQAGIALGRLPAREGAG